MEVRLPTAGGHYELPGCAQMLVEESGDLPVRGESFSVGRSE